MKKIISLLVFFTAVVASKNLPAEILESSDISLALVLARPESLLVFDLDNTLIEPVQLLGSDQWVGHQLETLVKKGCSMQEALAEVLPSWLSILKKTEMRVVDPVIPSLMNHLRQRKISCLGLTKRDPDAVCSTIEQLQKLNIHFFPCKNRKLLEEFPGGARYKEGVLFTGRGEDKGHCLLAYLKQFRTLPSHIIAIDDKIAHLKSIERASQSLGIPFIGIRYSITDERVKNFDPHIAEIQWNYFHKILSDEEAKKLL